MHDQSPLPAADVLDRLDADLDDLLALDTGRLDDAQLSAVVIKTQRVMSKLVAANAQLTGAWDARRCWKDDGARTGAAWLAGTCKMPAVSARSEIRFARRLRHLPATFAALAAGAINAHHARILARLHRPGLAEALARDEAMLVGEAARSPFSSFAKVAAYWEDVNDPEKREQDAAEQYAQRRAHLSQTFGHAYVLDALFDTVGGAKFAEALRRIEQQLFDADWAEARAEHGDNTTLSHLQRTPAQRRLDALVEMAERATAAPRDAKRPRPLITVLLDYQTFTGRVCELSNGIVLTPGQAATLLDEALIERIVFDGPSRVLDVGQARCFTGALRRAIEVRDRHCTHELCDEVPECCEVDHVDPTCNGGATTQENGRLRCPADNKRAYRDWRARRRRGPDPP